MNTKWSICLVFIVIVGVASQAIADTYAVINTGDSGVGSLRQAILDAESHAGADTIIFSIPTSDPNYDETVGVWTIRPSSELPQITDGRLRIDGTTQTSQQGDLNPHGPEMEIDGSNVVDCGFRIHSSWNEILGLVINRFSENGVIISGDDARRNIISGNYIGTDACGTMALPNYIGIKISDGASANTVGGNAEGGRNLISGNESCGVYIYGAGTEGNEVKGNYIGTDAWGETALGNSEGGIYISSGSNGNTIGGAMPEERNIIAGADSCVNVFTGNGITISYADNNMIVGNYIGTDRRGTNVLGNESIGICIYDGQYNTIGGTSPGEGNIIAGSGWAGVVIRPAGGANNTVIGNYIGTDMTGLIDLGNGSCGVWIDFGGHDNFIGSNNVISYNNANGVKICHDSTTVNTITQNSITNNGGLGIANEDGGNIELAPPTIMDITATHVSGTACPDCVVEIFSDSSDEGAIYQGSTIADTSGSFLWSGSAVGPHVTATATDTAGNTSQFSDPYILGVEWGEEPQVPRSILLEQNSPNPFGSSTEIQYELPRNGYVTLKVSNVCGEEIVTVVSEHQDAGRHSVIWDGLDSEGNRMPSGLYFYRAQLGDVVSVKKLVILR